MIGFVLFSFALAQEPVVAPVAVEPVAETSASTVAPEVVSSPPGEAAAVVAPEAGTPVTPVDGVVPAVEVPQTDAEALEAVQDSVFFAHSGKLAALVATLLGLMVFAWNRFSKKA